MKQLASNAAMTALVPPSALTRTILPDRKETDDDRLRLRGRSGTLPTSGRCLREPRSPPYAEDRWGWQSPCDGLGRARRRRAHRDDARRDARPARPFAQRGTGGERGPAGRLPGRAGRRRVAARQPRDGRRPGQHPDGSEQLRRPRRPGGERGHGAARLGPRPGHRSGRHHRSGRAGPDLAGRQGHPRHHAAAGGLRPRHRRVRADRRGSEEAPIQDQALGYLGRDPSFVPGPRSAPA